MTNYLPSVLKYYDQLCLFSSPRAITYNFKFVSRNLNTGTIDIFKLKPHDTRGRPSLNALSIFSLIFKCLLYYIYF